MIGKKKPLPPVDNEISDETGEFDQRFILWRRFCSLYNIPVETLPSQLEPKQHASWEDLKARRLRRPRR